MTFQKIIRHPLALLAVLSVLLALAVFLPRLYNLDGYVTVDEPDWLMFASNFYYAMEEEDYDRTLQIYHPGVTNLWLGTAVIQRYFPEHRDIASPDYQSGLRHERDLRAYGIEPLAMLWRMRLLTLLVNTALLVIAFALAQKLFGIWPAFVGSLLLAFEPYHLGLTRLHQIDGLLTGLFLVALLALLVFAFYERNWLYLALSGVMAGLAFLTKSPALYLIPTLGGLLLIALLVDLRAAGRWFDWRWLFTRLVLPLLFWFGIAALVYYALFPAMWVAPWETVGSIYGNAVVYASQGRALEFSEGQGFALRFPNLRSYLNVFLTHATLPTLFGVLAAVAALVLQPVQVARKAAWWSLLALLLFGGGYFIFMGVGIKSATHYVLPSFGPLALAAGVGWVAVLSALAARRTDLAQPKRIILAGAVILIVLQAIAAFRSLPYNYIYENPLVVLKRGGEPWGGYGYGEGLELAGEYLASKPNAEDLSVMAWYGIGPVSYYFPGESYWVHIGEWQHHDYLDMLQRDYLVTYINQYKRDLPHFLLKALESETPEQVFYVDGIPYVYVYKVSDLELANFDPGDK